MGQSRNGDNQRCGRISVPLGRRLMALLFANPLAGDVSAFVLLILPVILYFSLTNTDLHKIMGDQGKFKASVKASVDASVWLYSM